MAKVTSKLQLTLPKAIADRHGIRPGDEVTVVSAGEAIRILPARQRQPGDTQRRLTLFDQATARQMERNAAHAGVPSQADRGWTREELARTALRGPLAHQLSWFDAHLWAYREHYGLAEPLSEDFQHGRIYGTVQVRDPFRTAA